MSEKWKQFANQALEHGQQSWQSLQNKIADVSTSIGGMASRFSLVGLFHKGDEQRQIIHYFLLPGLSATKEDSLYVVHTFPQGVNPQDLKKHRIFHIAHESAMNRMRALVYQNIVSSKIPQEIPLSATELTLQELGQAIDDSGSKISGGMMLVGSLITLVNPVAGVALMAGSLVPDLGNWMSQKVLGGLSGKIAEKRLKKVEKEAQRVSKSEVKESTSEVVLNSILQQMAVLSTSVEPVGTHQPFPLPHEFPNAAWYGMTLEAIYETLTKSMKKNKNPQPIDHFLEEAESLRHAWNSTHSPTL